MFRKRRNVDADGIPKNASLSTLSTWAKELQHQGKYSIAEKYYSHVGLFHRCLITRHSPKLRRQQMNCPQVG
jgi:hypothetical protein